MRVINKTCAKYTTGQEKLGCLYMISVDSWFSVRIYG